MSMQTRLGPSALALTGAFWLAAPAMAVPLVIDPGFDLFATDAAGTFATLPGIGPVQLEGLPFDTGAGDRGNVDTILLRRGPALTLNGIGDSGSMPLELVALSLRSVAPVQISPGVFADVHVNVNKPIEDIGAPGGNDDGACDPGESCTAANPERPLDALPASAGALTITRTGENGGTFDSFFDVFAEITLTLPGTDTVIGSSTFQDTFVQQSGLWASTPGVGDAHTAQLPAGGFLPGVVAELALLASHRAGPAIVPEPATLALFGLGALWLSRRRPG